MVTAPMFVVGVMLLAFSGVVAHDASTVVTRKVQYHNRKDETNQLTLDADGTMSTQVEQQKKTERQKTERARMELRIMAKMAQAVEQVHIIDEESLQKKDNIHSALKEAILSETKNHRGVDDYYCAGKHSDSDLICGGASFPICCRGGAFDGFCVSNSGAQSCSNLQQMGYCSGVDGSPGCRDDTALQR